MNFSIITFGCKLNQAESSQISADLILAGFTEAGKNQKPDVIIISVCAVTRKAVREGRQKTAQLRRKYPKAKIIITGCIDENNWEGVDLWIKNKDKIIKILKNKIKIINKIQKPKPLLRNRAFIKIQTGCNNFCTYCIVPFMRGKPKDVLTKKIIKDILNKQEQGYREIILTGVNIGLYKNLIELLENILKSTEIERIRLGSLWPTHLNSKLINLVAKNSRLCPHFHLSIQSGSNKILKLMNRGYKAKDILKITDRTKKKIHNINFTADIIVGFPGETNQDFKDTCNLITKIGFSHVHIFKYSKRPRTKAAIMPGQIDEPTKQKRSQILHKIVQKSAKKIKIPPSKVLWEQKKNNYWHGFADNYIRVKKKSKKNLKNQITDF